MANMYYCIIWIEGERFYLSKNYDGWWYGYNSFRDILTKVIKEAKQVTPGEKITLTPRLKSNYFVNKKIVIDKFVYVGVGQYKKYLEYFG